MKRASLTKVYSSAYFIHNWLLSGWCILGCLYKTTDFLLRVFTSLHFLTSPFQRSFIISYIYIYIHKKKTINNRQTKTSQRNTRRSTLSDETNKIFLEEYMSSHKLHQQHKPEDYMYKKPIKGKTSSAIQTNLCPKQSLLVGFQQLNNLTQRLLKLFSHRHSHSHLWRAQNDHTRLLKE